MLLVELSRQIRYALTLTAVQGNLFFVVPLVNNIIKVRYSYLIVI